MTGGLSVLLPTLPRTLLYGELCDCVTGGTVCAAAPFAQSSTVWRAASSPTVCYSLFILVRVDSRRANLQSGNSNII